MGKNKGHPIKYYRAMSRRVKQIFVNNPRVDLKQPPKKLPPMTEQVTNFRHAVIKHMKWGRRRVSLDTYLSRVYECRNCIHRENVFCTICGCRMHIKCWWASARCAETKNPRWLEDNGESGV